MFLHVLASDTLAMTWLQLVHLAMTGYNWRFCGNDMATTPVSAVAMAWLQLVLLWRLSCCSGAAEASTRPSLVLL